MAYWLGLGTHLSKNTTEEVLSHGISKGVDLIDTAPNYCNGTAHDIVKRVITKQETPPNISTKVGFLKQGEQDQLPENIRNLIQAGVEANNVLSPEYVLYQGKKNYRSLGSSKLACLYLHNPEVHLHRLGKKRMGEQLQKCFEACEELCAAGYYESYGIATWSKLLEVFLPIRLSEFASMAAGAKHNFRYLQLPISLVCINHVAELFGNNSGPLVDAHQLGITIVASSPLHTGELPKMMGSELTSIFKERSAGIPLTSAQAAVLFVKSTPYISNVLVGCSSTDQLDELIFLDRIPKLDKESMSSIVSLLLDESN